MNQGFKFKFNEMREGSPVKDEENKDQDTAQANEKYPAPGHNRNLCFSWLDGKRQFLNYAYLVSGASSPNGNGIELEFTTHTVTLKGSNLNILYEALLEQLPKTISCFDSRYNETVEENEAIVNEISIERISM